jgi:transcriptional regulator with XRE-family HTH domain
MEDQRLGAALRAMRIRRGWRQTDLADRIGCSDSTVSRVERGQAGELRVDTLRRLSAAVELRVDLVPRWRGGDLDRLIARHHIALSSVTTTLLRDHGWVVVPEASLSIWGARGAIDLLAWHPVHRALAVI